MLHIKTLTINAAGYEFGKLTFMAKDALMLTSVRSAYMVQLLVSLVGATAKSDRWTKLLHQISNQECIRSLTHLDSFCCNGIEEYCASWTDALNSLMNVGHLDVKSILKKNISTPLTAQAAELLGSAVGPDDPTSSDAPVQVWTVDHLFSFGAAASIPAADELAIYQAELHNFLLKRARLVVQVVTCSCNQNHRYYSYS